MKLTIKLFLVMFLLCSYFGNTQERTSDRQKISEDIVNNNEVNKSTSEKRSVILEANPIDLTQAAEIKTKTTNFLETVDKKRVNNNRKKVDLIAKPTERDTPKRQKSVQTDGDRPENRNENRVELKAILISPKD